jgi:hypothetical protein
MPQKPLRQRLQKAKREGVAPSLKDVDIGRIPASSSHALKKSRHVAGFGEVEERNVRPKAPPGEGRGRRKTVSRPQAAAHRASGKTQPVSRVQGRKKEPSRMNIKAKGGPLRRSRLHGG